MDTADLALFERSLKDATGRTSGTGLDTALDDLGWTDALVEDPRSAISLLFAQQGAANATSASLGRIIAHALGAPSGPGIGMVLPAIGRWVPPGALTGDRLRVRGLAPAGLVDQPTTVIAASTGDGVVSVTVPRTTLGFRPVAGVDPALSLLEVEGELTADRREVVAPLADWDGAVALGRLALAHELVGASRAMLELACEHARTRVQFGHPIGSFQAVSHRLAETLVAIAMAEAMLDAAWLDPTPTAAAMAKAVAGRQARTTARHAQQVLAGIGFTVEHPLHRYVRRALVLDALLGSAASLSASLGTELIATHRLPPLLPL